MQPDEHALLKFLLLGRLHQQQLHLHCLAFIACWGSFRTLAPQTHHIDCCYYQLVTATIQTMDTAHTGCMLQQ